MRIEDVFTESAPFEQAFAEALFRDVKDYDRGVVYQISGNTSDLLPVN